MWLKTSILRISGALLRKVGEYKASQHTSVTRKREHPEPSILSGGPMSDHVYKHLELTGSSPKGSDDAIRVAIGKAAKTVRNMHWFNVKQTRGLIENGKISHWQVTLEIGFTLED